MKQTIFLLLIIASIFTACNKDEEISLIETGTVINYGGAGNCGIIIQLDNGNRIQPSFYPNGFTFAEDQRVLVEYTELHNIISSCDRGVTSEITYIEELSCSPYVELNFDNYDSLARDPVNINEIFVDGNCLQIELSYSGGCEEHTINLALIHPWIYGSSSIPTFEIRHNAHGDLCEAYFTRELRYDLTPLILDGIDEIVLTAKLAAGENYYEIIKIIDEQ